jgi:hypothetical protein
MLYWLKPTYTQPQRDDNMRGQVAWWCVVCDARVPESQAGPGKMREEMWKNAMSHRDYNGTMRTTAMARDTERNRCQLV